MIDNGNSNNITGEFIKPIDVSNDRNTKMDIDQWAEKCLDNIEYFNYLEAKDRQDAILEDAKSTGVLTHVPVIEYFYSETLKQTIPVTVGIRVIIREGETLALDEEYMIFEEKYSKSPEVHYNPVL